MPPPRPASQRLRCWSCSDLPKCPEIMGADLDAEAGCPLDANGAVGVADALHGIVDQAVGAVELGVGRVGGDGAVKGGRGGGGTLVHLADHEGDFSGSEAPSARDGGRDAAELDDFEMCQKLAAGLDNAVDVVWGGEAF